MKTTVHPNQTLSKTNDLADQFKLALLLLAFALFTALTSCSNANSQPTDPKISNNPTNLNITQAANHIIEVQDGTLAATAEESKLLNIHSIEVIRAEICSGIANREPVGISNTFSEDVGRVYLYTKVTLPKGQSATIQHVWKLEEKVISVVDLDVRGPAWRTKSYKTIGKNMRGNWTVDVLSEEGTPLKTVAFRIE